MRVKRMEKPRLKYTACNHISAAQITLHQRGRNRWSQGGGGAVRRLRRRECTDGIKTGGFFFLFFFSFLFFPFTVALLSAGAENFASIVAAREGRRESTVTMETSIPLTHTTNPLRTH